MISDSEPYDYGDVASGGGFVDHTFTITNGGQSAASSISYDENTKESKFTVIESVLPASQKSMDEARGYIIADYQDHLEAEWIEMLRSKYSSSINEDVLNSIIK